MSGSLEEAYKEGVWKTGLDSVTQAGDKAEAMEMEGNDFRTDM